MLFFIFLNQLTKKDKEPLYTFELIHEELLRQNPNVVSDISSTWFMSRYDITKTPVLMNVLFVSFTEQIVFIKRNSDESNLFYSK